MFKCVIEILNHDVVFQPIVMDGIKIEWQRKSTAGKLEFTALNDGILDLDMGAAVRLRVFELYEWHNVFYGYIFKLEDTKDGQTKITCYDQLRYFKNKDTYCYGDIKASDLLQRICADYNLAFGAADDTGYVIPQRIESNKTLFDIMQNALDLSMQNVNEIYCLYDDYGKIMLRNIQCMKYGIRIDEDTAQDFSYTSSIDSDTYNQVKLTYDNKETGKRDVYLAKDSSNINRWGILQYHDTLQKGENGAYKAQMLLQYYNRISRGLTIKKAFGDINVRAGCYIMVRLALPDYWVDSYMLVEKVTHNLNENLHTMDLTLTGGDFTA